MNEPEMNIPALPSSLILDLILARRVASDTSSIMILRSFHFQANKY